MVCVRVLYMERYAGLQHTSPYRAHVHTPNVMLPHHHTDFLHFQQFLKSVTLIRNIRASWRWSEWWSKHVGAF